MFSSTDASKLEVKAVKLRILFFVLGGREERLRQTKDLVSLEKFKLSKNSSIPLFKLLTFLSETKTLKFLVKLFL